jgi:hypothetical protein
MSRSLLLLLLACCAPHAARTTGATSSDAAPTVTMQAGFAQAPPRTVSLKGQPFTIEATGHLFYNLWPADESPEPKPIVILFNGFADDIVRAYGTGPQTVTLGGDVAANPASYTRFANLIYVEPRQAGYSYDVLSNRAPDASDCGPSVFNEYVDAADVLFAVLAILKENPSLRGPVYWLAESYGGVRLTWILTYLRARWSLVPYADPLLEKTIAGTTRGASLFAGQILLESWLAGGDEATAITNECSDPIEIAGVEASIGVTCATADACSCTTTQGHSLYNYAYTESLETQREYDADVAHVVPAKAEALLGIGLTSIVGLGSEARAKGFKCSPPDDTVPDESGLVALLGSLPKGQFYFVPYSPLQPGKQQTGTSPVDWNTQPYEAVAFADNLHDVPAFLTKGDEDLVVPTLALAPALRAALGDARIDTAESSRLGIRYSDGERFISIFDYPTAGHMITMLEPSELATDLQAWSPLAEQIQP